MPKGRSKGFGHYMNKKFFHPGNPENLERVYIAKEKVARKEKLEKEKLQEYQREQDLWENRASISKNDKDRMSLSFMYDPPTGTKAGPPPRRADVSPPPGGAGGAGGGAGTSKGKKDGDKKNDFKFEWQRNAPRLEHVKDDPNIIDQPFGIQVQFTKCLKCQIWGHQHTDKICPRYVKAKDNVDEQQVEHHNIHISF